MKGGLQDLLRQVVGHGIILDGSLHVADEFAGFINEGAALSLVLMEERHNLDETEETLVVTPGP